MHVYDYIHVNVCFYMFMFLFQFTSMCMLIFSFVCLYTCCARRTALGGPWGMPELKLGLSDKLLFEATGRPVAKGKSVEKEDINFYQCVRLARFENDRTISFIPPDGEFELMSYRLNTHIKRLIWVEAVIDPT